MTSHPQTHFHEPRPPLRVFFDGECPLCAREIAFYQGRRGAERIQWVDVSVADVVGLPHALSVDQALSQFHVEDERGVLLSGGEAFAALWSALPAFAILGRFFRLPVMRSVLGKAYLMFLRYRPTMVQIINKRPANLDEDCACGS